MENGCEKPSMTRGEIGEKETLTHKRESTKAYFLLKVLLLFPMNR